MSNANVIGARKAAKNIARNEGIPHQQALDRVAIHRGFRHWGDLLAAAGPARVKPAPADALLEMLELAVSIGVTDVHCEQFVFGPELSDMRSEVRMRIDGVLQQVYGAQGFMCAGLHRVVLDRARLSRDDQRMSSGELDLRSGAKAGIAYTPFDLDALRAREPAKLVIRLPWVKTATRLDEIGVCEGDGWDVVRSARTGLIVICGMTNTMKTTIGQILVKERRADGVDAVLLDDVRDQDGLLSAVAASHVNLVLVVLHGRGTGDAVARLSGLMGPGMFKDVPLVGVIGTRKVPRECSACLGGGCPVCADIGNFGTGVLMVAEGISAPMEVLERASKVIRGDDMPEISRLPAQNSASEAMRDAGLRSSSLARIGDMFSDMAKATHSKVQVDLPVS